MSERARIFENGSHQAIELPDTYRFPEGLREVSLRREGEAIVLEPVTPREWVNGWSPEFLAALGSLKDEDIPRPESEDISTLRDPFK